MKKIEIRNVIAHEEGFFEGQVWIDNVWDGHISVDKNYEVGGSYSYENLSIEEENFLIELAKKMAD